MGQRQIFQTANLEAVRQAQDVGEQFQREAARRKVTEENLAEGAHTVHGISASDQIRTEERQQQRRQQQHPSHAEGTEPESGVDSAEDADPHLDFFA